MVTPTNTQPTTENTLRVANANADRYLHELRGAYAGLRLYDPDFAVHRDPYIYEKMLRDPVIRQCLTERLRTVAGGDWSVVPARNPTDEDAEAARVMEQVIAELEYSGFQMARYNLAKFVWEGARHGAVYGRRELRNYGDDEFREWWFPTRIRDLNKRRVRVWREDGRFRRKLARITDKQDRISYDDVPFPMDRMITAIYDDEEQRLGWGRGLGDSIYWFFYMMWKMLAEGPKAAAVWAQGVTVIKTDSTAPGTTAQSAEDTKQALITAWKNAKAQGIVAMGLTDEADHYDGTGQGAQMILEWLRFFHDCIRGLITGARLPSGGGSDTSGSLARAEVEQETSQGVYQLDSAVLDDAFTRGLVKPIWERNRENFAELGLGTARMPTFRSFNEKNEDEETNSRVITSLAGVGFEFKKDEVYAKVGLTPPTDEDREQGNVIGGAQGLPPGFPGAGDDGQPGDPGAKDQKEDGNGDFARLGPFRA